MRFAVHFVDDEQHVGRRRELMPEHLEFLKRRKSTILSAGPLFDVGSGKGAGGQWIVEAFDLAEVQRLVEEDPFFPSGLRKSIRILEWKLVFENGVSRI